MYFLKLFVHLKNKHMSNSKTDLQNLAIKELKNLDPLLQAEKLTGSSYKKDNATSLLGFAIHIEKSREMNKLMDETNDTRFSEKTEDYLDKVKSFNFEQILKEDFQSDGITESLYIFWHKEYSILLSFDTYKGSRNGSKFYYNWSPNDRKSRADVTSSGGYNGFYWKSDFSEEQPFIAEPIWEDGVSWEDYNLLNKEWRQKSDIFVSDNNLKALWVGDHDGREALKFNINNLAKNGEFVKNWKKRPFLWLLHHGDKKTGNYQEINQERINRFPDYVKNCIGTNV